MRKKVEDSPNLERDVVSKAILNTDKDGLLAYKIQRNRAINMKKVESEVETLKGDVTEIKNMLSAILQKLNN